MDNTMLVKVLAGIFAMVCTMILAILGKIDGPQALGAIQTVTGVFLGSAAVLGVGKAIAGSMAIRATGSNGNSLPPPPSALPRVPPMAAGALLCLALGVAALAVVVSCASAIPVAQGVIQFTEAECVQLEKQPEPDWVNFLCSIAHPAPGVAASYTLRVPATQAREFAAAHAPKS